jgi:methionyl-tRNA synthetase
MENIFSNALTINAIKEVLNQTTFITTALPYANGELHLGHIFEALSAQVYSQNKANTVFLAGEDQHGVAITLHAKKFNIKEHEHIKNQFQIHQKQYQNLAINHDYYGQTHDTLHEKLVLFFFKKLKEKGQIFKKPTLGWFDEIENQFLPDRFVRGICPHCKSENQYPEICENCGKHFSNEQLINPISKLSHTTPTLKTSLHYFLKTNYFYDNLKNILQNNANLICEQAKAKLLDGSLEVKNEIDISRDEPYFGINITDGIQKTNQCFYVWFDAPIGYLSFALSWIQKNYLKAHNQTLSFDDLLELLPHIQFEHFIGKDIVYFHTYYWLNLLHLLDLNSVKKIHTHGWITQKGEKLSKSQENSTDFLDNLTLNQVDALRLYLFSHYENNVQDIEFDENQVWQNYNQVIVGKYANLYSRVSKIIETKLNGNIELNVLNPYHNQLNQLKTQIEKGEFKLAYQNWIILLNDLNSYFQQSEVWKKENQKQINEICVICLQTLLNTNWLKSICPHVYEGVEKIEWKNKITHIHLAYKL